MIRHDHVIKVYYRDIDQMGIVYYSRYLEYFEEARTELLVSLGLDVPSIEKGFREAADNGFLAGHPMQNVRFVVEDGQAHENDC